MGNEISEISQGLIVETIINEYKKSKQGETPRDLFLTAPTGAGKSLLFQLPAFYVSQLGDITIVVSPLIALMKDQVSAIINDRNFTKVAYLNSEINLIDRENIIENCKNGNIDILYMAPELLLSYHISHFIGERNLGLVVIDEAHLITTWGRDFRVDYWFLGNHINKIRKYENLKFPMVAVTATAVYGGENDMVFDSIDNLSMQNPHIFIGQVKRDDITFVINNYENFKKDYEKNKLNQTVDFIKSVNEIGLKTLIYAPYTKHIEDIIRNLRRDNLDIATGYYGSLPPEHKELAFRLFSSGDKKVMIATKAFGMGVDISDIELVYHHAPSGLLPDYIQEIGRVARRNDIKGFAALNYSTQDQRFTKVLHGMSSIKKWQIQEVLKKIYNLHIKNKENRNLLISSEDFGAIFENTKQSSIDQKVLTALMMIEKDYLAKYRFNVLIARPKKLFTKCYAKINDNGFTIYKNRYPNTYTYISNDNGHHIIEINLDKLWNKSFRDQNFAIVKKLFYEKKLLNNINLIPLLKISFKLEDLFNNIYNRIQSTFNNIANIFIGFNGRYFNQIEFEKKLNSFINNEFKAKKLAEFILSSYSGILIRPGVIEGNAFLQKRRTGDDFTYRVFNQRYLYRFNQIIERFNILFNNNNNTIAERFITKIENNTINYIRLGCLLEIMEYGTFEVKGGDNPMIFIRINDPKKLRKDAYSNDYNNTLLSSTLNRYSTSNQIFDHFFLRDFSNEERWNFIEDFFLGTDIDELLSNHRGREQKIILILLIF